MFRVFEWGTLFVFKSVGTGGGHGIAPTCDLLQEGDGCLNVDLFLLHEMW